MPHEIRHAVDHDDGRVLLFVTVERVNKPRSIFTIHHVDGEDDIRGPQVVFNFRPLVVSEWRAKVVGCDLQLEFVLAINFALRLFQRPQETRPYIQDGDLHRLNRLLQANKVYGVAQPLQNFLIRIPVSAIVRLEQAIPERTHGMRIQLK